MTRAETSEGEAETVTHDHLLGGRVRLWQPKQGMRASIDAIFLAAAIPAKSGEHIFEAGIGSGAASLALLARVPGIQITGVDIEPGALELAARNGEQNGWRDAINLIETDITTATVARLAAIGACPPFDHALAHPPFQQPRPGRLPGRSIHIAPGRRPAGALQEWVVRLAGLVRGGGTVTLIHQAPALPELLAAMQRQLGGLVVLPLAPRAGMPAKRVLVRATRGSRAPLRLLAPWTLHRDGGDYTCQTQAVLRDAMAIDLASDKQPGAPEGG
ncbi:MAG: tRNA1(Val) (adenine(37)-N6)-methyltransferase [Hyphomicrobiales bacterium]